MTPEKKAAIALVVLGLLVVGPLAVGFLSDGASPEMDKERAKEMARGWAEEIGGWFSQPPDRGELAVKPADPSSPQCEFHEEVGEELLLRIRPGAVCIVDIDSSSREGQRQVRLTRAGGGDVKIWAYTPQGEDKEGPYTSLEEDDREALPSASDPDAPYKVLVGPSGGTLELKCPSGQGECRVSL